MIKKLKTPQSLLRRFKLRVGKSKKEHFVLRNTSLRFVFSKRFVLRIILRVSFCHYRCNGKCHYTCNHDVFSNIKVLHVYLFCQSKQLVVTGILCQFRIQHNLACGYHHEVIRIQPAACHQRTFIGINPTTSHRVVFCTGFAR